MPTICRFVSDVVSSPSVLLDLNDTTRASGLMIGNAGLGLSPPPLRRAAVSTMLRDGEHYPATAYGNRTITVPLVLTTGTDDAAAAAVRNLLKELDKPRNVLQVQIGTTPVFFRTWRSDLVLSMARNLLRDGKVTLEIPADPFGLGAEQTATNGYVSADPTAGVGLFRDITGVLGDVPSPIIVNHPAGDGSLGTEGGNAWLTRQVMYAIRSRGTPSALTYHTQAESMTNGTNVVDIVDAQLLGGNGVRWTPPNTSQHVLLSGPLLPTAATTELNGRYRMLAAIRQNVGGDFFYFQAEWGPPGNNYSIKNAEVYFTNVDNSGPIATPMLVDLGTIDVGTLGMVHGETTTARKATAPFVRILGRRASGSGTLDIDYILAIPADEGMAVVEHYVYGGGVNILDGVNGYAVALDATTAAIQRMGSVRGGVPHIVPGRTNRLWIIPGLYSDIYPSNLYAVIVTYFPRYLLVPGATA